MTAPRTYEQQIGDLREALTGSRSLGSWPDTVVDRLGRAVDVGWDLAEGAGVADRVPVIAGTAVGPHVEGGPTTLLADVTEQTTSRWRRGAHARPRTLAELARQLEHLVVALTAPGVLVPAQPPPATPRPTPPSPTPRPSTPTAPSPPPAAGSWPDALWVGRWRPGLLAVGGKHDDGSTYGNVQYQRASGEIVNSTATGRGGAPQVPIVTHPLLGECLRLSLGPGVMRHEVQADGDADAGWGPGIERWFGFRFALAADFPLAQRDTWAIISQVHQASHSGPPPLELDACRGGLWIRGNGAAYLREVCDLEVDRAYDVLVGLRIGRGHASRIDVVVDGEHHVRGFAPPIDIGAGCYWKGASAYARPSIRRPWTVFQRDHRIGQSRESVA